MTITGRLAGFFPALYLLLAGTCLALSVAWSVLWAAGLVVVLYLLPPLLWRLYKRVLGHVKHIWALNRPQRCDWWVAHQLQSPYIAFPMLESGLRLVPGLYSAWLRLWGAQVGRAIHWTPQLDLLDRHNLKLGDRIVFGHRVALCCHVVVKKKSGLLILIERGIDIGDDCFIGATAAIGPGVKIPAGSHISYGSEIRFKYDA